MRTRNKFKSAAEKFLTGNYTLREAYALAEWQQVDLSKEKDEPVSEVAELKDIKARMLHNIQMGIATVSYPSETPKTGTIIKSFWTRSWISAVAILTLAAVAM